MKESVLVFAQEAGAASYISHQLKNLKPKRVLVLAERAAVQTFHQEGFKVQDTGTMSWSEIIKLVTKFQPECFCAGASPGPSLEKRIHRWAEKNKIPVYSFLDHFWNLWQRYAHPRTAKKWAYLPSKVFVINEKVAKRLQKLGCPKAIVEVLPHQVFKPKYLPAPTLSRSELLTELNLDPKTKYFLFVSENLFKASKKWSWDQPEKKDIHGLAVKLLKAIKQQGESYRLIIKTHPAESWNWQKIIPRELKNHCVVVSQLDRASLIQYAEKVFGLSSIMLLESVARKKETYSAYKNLHSIKLGVRPFAEDKKFL